MKGKLAGDSPDSFKNMARSDQVAPQKATLTFTHGEVNQPPLSPTMLKVSLKEMNRVNHHLNQLTSFTLAALLLASMAGLKAAVVRYMRCEYLAAPFGLDVGKPRLSWVTKASWARTGPGLLFAES